MATFLFLDFDPTPRKNLQLPVSFLQILLRPFSIFDIDTRTKPFDDIPVLVEQGRDANQEPAILPVSPSQAHLTFVHFAGCLCPAPLFQGRLKILWMDSVRFVFNCLLQTKTR